MPAFGCGLAKKVTTSGEQIFLFNHMLCNITQQLITSKLTLASNLNSR